jgi:hypothetical protein
MRFSKARHWLALGTSALVLATAAYACTSQGEGQPCIVSVDNNSNDNQCASPFQCVVPPNCSTAACCAEGSDGGITSTLATCQACPTEDSGASDAATDAGGDAGAIDSSAPDALSDAPSGIDAGARDAGASDSGGEASATPEGGPDGASEAGVEDAGDGGD